MTSSDAAVPAIERPRVVVDCDPGHDDVIAIVVAAVECELVGITTVSGNAPLEHCTRNALATVELLGIGVEVHPGADRPIVREPTHDAAVHGEDGLGGVAVPAPARQPAAPTALEWLLEVSRAVEGLWLVATGPLTNVALALRADPGLAGRLAGISLMGGGVTTGNVTPAAEFNFWCDPEAAAVVLDSGVPIRMCGLDVTQQVLIDREDAERVRAVGGGRLGGFLAGVLDATVRRAEATALPARAPLHDPCAVAALTHPHLFEFEHLHVAVETAGRDTAGMSVADRRRGTRGWAGHPNAHVALGVDGAAVVQLIHGAIERAGTLP